MAIDPALEADIQAVAGITAVPTILKILSKTTGMRFSAVARVTEERWIICSANDGIPYGLGPGSELPIETTFCDTIRRGGPPVVFDSASTHPIYSQHPSPKMYGLESYASFPIRLPDGTFFGTLCALDPEPMVVDTAETREMFEMFADIIGYHLSTSDRMDAADATLKEERAVSALREQFIAVLGHDLRNPLNAIRASASVLALSPLDGNAAKVVRIIEGSVDRMSGLIDDVMDFARGRLGDGIHLDLDCGVRLEPALRQVVTELQGSARDRLIVADIDLPAEEFRCDQKRISQLASNLLGNALTYGAPGEPVEFSAGRDGGDFVLSVANAGKPISPDTMSRIFEPFERGGNQRSLQGLGLGLYIAHSIAKAHDGTLQVKSDFTETRFTFRMPVRAMQD